MNIKKVIILLLILSGVLFVAGPVHAGPTETITNPSGPAVIDTLINPAGSSDVQTIGGIFGLIKNLLFTVIGLVLAGVILYGGFTFMTSQGEPEQLKKAQSIILYGIIGIAVIALSVIIIQLVARIIGVDVSSIL